MIRLCTSKLSSPFLSSRHLGANYGRGRVLLACMHHGARERAGNRRKGGRGFARWPFYWICGCRIASRQSRQSRQDNDDQEETERARASRARISKGKDGLVALGTCMPGFFFFFFTGIKTMTMMMYLRPPFMPVASHVITFSPCFTLPCFDRLLSDAVKTPSFFPSHFTLCS